MPLDLSAYWTINKRQNIEISLIWKCLLLSNDYKWTHNKEKKIVTL